MGNLVANAIQATPKTGGVIELVARTMPDGGTEIRVSNPGAKIRPAERERIFDRFYRIGQVRIPHQDDREFRSNVTGDSGAT